MCDSTRVDLLHFGHCPYLEADSTVVRTDYWIHWANFTVSYSGQVRLVSLLYVAKSDWFHYCIIVCTV